MKTSAKRLIHPAEFERMALLLGDDIPLLDKAEAIRRQAILERWSIAKRGGWELGYVESQVSARFILTLQARFGLVVCRGSLFNWDRRYRAGGLAALVDGRLKRNKFRGKTHGGIDGRS